MDFSDFFRISGFFSDFRDFLRISRISRILYGFHGIGNPKNPPFPPWFFPDNVSLVIRLESQMNK
jgi:hypothetical protein